jgi:Thioredoxin
MKNFNEALAMAKANFMKYDSYKQHVMDLLAQQQITSGEPTQAMLDYTQLNVARMTRVEKTTQLSARLLEKSKHAQPFYFVVITEGWCGDAAQLGGIFNQIAAANNTECYYVLRDKNLPLMDLFLTNGTSRSIPIVLCINKSTDDLLWHWGPRPATAQAVLDELKLQNVDMEIQKQELHAWYAKDKAHSTFSELELKFEL